MNKGTIKLTYKEIDKLLESTDEDVSVEIKWKFVSEEDIDFLLEKPDFYS